MEAMLRSRRSEALSPGSRWTTFSEKDRLTTHAMELLDLLVDFSPDGWIPLSGIARRLGLDERTAVEALRRLEQLGYQLEWVPNVGVRYVAAPEHLVGPRIAWLVRDCQVIRHVEVYEEVGSTNDMALDRLGRAPCHGLAIFAEYQTAGRGRGTNRWLAPPRRCLLVSVVLVAQEVHVGGRWLTCLGAAAVADVVASCCQLEPRIKWPNDVCVGGKKVCGILVEERTPAVDAPGRAERMPPSRRGWVLGIGLNVNLTREELPPELQETATSLYVASHRVWDRTSLAGALLCAVDRYYVQGLQGHPQAVWSRFRELLKLEGQFVQATFLASSSSGRIQEERVVGRVRAACPQDGLELERRPDGEVLRLVPDAIVRLVPLESPQESLSSSSPS
jgi:BirA family biotin operon repressor/biotin-[acetyl-CoA-carboxylase] ligase